MQCRLYISILSIFLGNVLVGQNLTLDAQKNYNQEKYLKVIEITNSAIEAEQDGFEIWLVRANAFQKLDQFEKSIEAYQIAERFSKDSYELYANIGAAFYNQGNYEMAERNLKRSIKINEDYPQANYFLGNVAYSKFKTSAALKLYTRAIDKDPKYRDALYMRSAVYFELGQYQKALRDIDLVIQIDPNLQLAKFNKALILLNGDEYEKSLGILKELNPALLKSSTDYYYYLGETLYFTGSKDEACEAYSQAAKLGDQESEDIYTKFCLTGIERKARKQKRTISMSF